MDNEQLRRFEDMQKLVGEAEEALESIRHITESGLSEVDNHSPQQAESLQRIQQYAGTAVDALKQTWDLARHARSYQAQAHQRDSGNKPQ